MIGYNNNTIFLNVLAAHSRLTNKLWACLMPYGMPYAFCYASWSRPTLPMLPLL